jgi:hypothetical protein
MTRRKILNFITAAIILGFAGGASAAVLDLKKFGMPRDETELALDFKKGLDMRINGSLVTVKLYKTGISPESVCDYYDNLADKEGAKKVQLTEIDALAFYLLSTAAGGRGMSGYRDVFFKDQKSRSIMAAAAAAGDATLVVKLIIYGDIRVNGFSGYDDGLGTMQGAGKVMSLEFLEAGKTAHFSNFYNAGDKGLREIKEFYMDSLKKNNWKVLFTDTAGGLIYAKKTGREYMINIAEYNGCFWINITG